MLEPFGDVLWARVGHAGPTMWVHIVPMLGQWAPFLPAGASFGPPWAIVERSWRDHAAISDQFHAILGLLGSLGPSWRHLGENAGPSCGHLETLSDHLGALLDYLKMSHRRSSNFSRVRTAPWRDHNFRGSAGAILVSCWEY